MGDALDYFHFIVVNRSIAAHRDAEQQVAVLADDVGEYVDDGAGAFVIMLFEVRPGVMPTADAGVGLPRQRFDAVARAAFDVPGHALSLLFIEHFAEEDALRDAVVEVRGDL